MGKRPRKSAPVREAAAVRKSAPVAARGRGPEPANRGGLRIERTHSAMPGATLHGARIVRPLHCINDWVETRSHQVAQMPSPTIFALHVRSDSNVDNSTLIVKTRFLFLRSVISTLYCRHLATDAGIQLF